VINTVYPDDCCFHLWLHSQYKCYITPLVLPFKLQCIRIRMIIIFGVAKETIIVLYIMRS
jgi:hypothetical protein